MDSLGILGLIWLSIITALLGLLGIWVRLKIVRAERNITEIHKMKREALQQMIDLHSELVSGKELGKDWLKRFAQMRKEIVVWAPDDVLIEYAQYNEKRNPDSIKSIKDYEVYFGKAILAYRKEFGLKNRRNRLKPEHISAIFKAGWDKTL